MSGQVKVVEGLIGFRGWQIKVFPDREPVLQSFYTVIYENSLWRGSVFEADRPPTLENKHGIYAYSSTERFLEEVRPRGDKITGFVEADGQTVLHEHGFRTERVRIKELALPLCSYDSCCKEAKWLVTHTTFLYHKLLCEYHARVFTWDSYDSPFGDSRFNRKTCTTSYLQEVWSRRYQCEVLPAPRWCLPTVYRVGDIELIYDPTRD